MALSARNDWLLGSCGALLIISQYVCVREFGSCFFSTEIITLTTTVMILLGPSLAFFASKRLGEKILYLFGIATFITLVSMPLSIRYLVGLSSKFHLEWLSMSFLFLLGCLFCSAYFAIFLPRLYDPSVSFKRLYALELLGAIFGLVLIGASLAVSWQSLITLFWLLVVLVIHLSIKKKILTALALITVCGASYFYPRIDKLAMENYLNNYWYVKNARVIETKYSVIQRIDIVQEADGKAIYLDGVPYYQSGDLHWFNYYISALPGAMLKHKGTALVIGSGSLNSTNYLLKEGFDVTTVDIDKNVAEFGLKYFNAINPKQAKFHLVIDDARAYVHNLDKKFDLIILDTPAPYHLQTSMLYTKSFFEDLKKHLNPGGIASINTCSWHLDDEIGSSIARGATEVFDDITTIQGESVGLTIMYCSDKLPFNTLDLRNELAKKSERKFTVFDKAGLETFLNAANARAHGIKNPIALLALSRMHLPRLKQN
ncbi:MAG: hypothetical protein KIT34_18115 [Cyanobacteria bacterium TGS_CYA1]|nr:hypothetical protein [Cyanobacteria bacterium TGS_CYA1]